MPGFFEKFYFWAGSLLIQYQNQLESGKAVDVTSEKSVSSAKFTILISWSLYTFNHFSLSLKWVATLVATTCRNMESRQTAKHYLRYKGKEVREETISFYFQIEYCSGNRILFWELSWKSRNGNKQFQATMSKALAEFF